MATPKAMAPTVRPDSDDFESDGADDSDSDGADDAFAAEPNDGARPPVASPGGSRSDSTTATTALVRPFLSPPRTSCPTATLMRAPLLTGLL